MFSQMYTLRIHERSLILYIETTLNAEKEIQDMLKYLQSIQSESGEGEDSEKMLSTDDTISYVFEVMTQSKIYRKVLIFILKVKLREKSQHGFWSGSHPKATTSTFHEYHTKISRM